MATPAPAKLPELVENQLGEFVAAAQSALGADLRSIVLFGSAAEGRMRATSDVNVVLVLRQFDGAKVDAIREALRIAHASIQLNPMFLLESEIADAVEAFSVKFADILNRHVTLAGSDPFAGIVVSRDAALRRVRQVSLNLTLRLRQTYALRSLREEQIALAIADAAGPLRATAMTLLDLDGQHASSPKEALRTMASRLPGEWSDVLDSISEAREERALPPGRSQVVLLRLIDLANELHRHAARLRP
jgi:predicted nucleotidyltransferase